MGKTTMGTGRDMNMEKQDKSLRAGVRWGRTLGRLGFLVGLGVLGVGGIPEGIRAGLRGVGLGLPSALGAEEAVVGSSASTGPGAGGESGPSGGGGEVDPNLGEGRPQEAGTTAPQGEAPSQEGRSSCEGCTKGNAGGSMKPRDFSGPKQVGASSSEGTSVEPGKAVK